MRRAVVYDARRAHHSHIVPTTAPTHPEPMAGVSVSPGEAAMALSVCAEPGCPTLTDRGRCHGHRRSHDRARGTRQQRGYDADYDRRRAADTQAMSQGAVLTCWRCGHTIQPHDYSLGHCDDDRRVIHGPEHLRRCNLANTRGDCPHPTHISPGA